LRVLHSIPAAAFAEFADFVAGPIAELEGVDFGDAVQREAAWFDDDVVARAHVGRQAAGVASEVGFGELGAGALLDEGDDGLRPDLVIDADDAGGGDFIGEAS
jgi:hypothetical protein